MTEAYHAGNLANFIQKERLPPGYDAIVNKYYAPLAAAFAERQTELARTIVIGVSGPQGSGKSTLAKVIALLLQSDHDKRAVLISLDDIYLTKAERQKLANDIHPLLVTRGVPGTHGVTLGCRVIETLINAKRGDVTLIPRFDKSTDDRFPEQQWESYIGAPDIIIFEGWCVGASPQSDNELAQPANELERTEDAQGAWRRYVNDCLAREYEKLFAPIDLMIYLSPPEYGCVFQWRALQEAKLDGAPKGAGRHIMDAEELKRFMMHYERLTRHMMKIMPSRADIIIDLDAAQHVLRVG